MLEEAYFAALQWHVRACHDLAIAATAFDRAGVPWLTFKGPVLAEGIYRRSDLRSYADLDLLVPPDRLRDAIGVLEGIGGELLDRNWHLALTRMHGELHVRLPTGTTADLHWHVVNESTLREAFPADTDDMVSRARTVEIDGRPIRTFTVEDTLVHLALHACTSGGNRLLWCKDLEQAAQQEALDWDAVVARARSWDAGPCVAVMLTVASRAMSFDVAPEVLRALSPGPLWRRLARVTDRLSPLERWDGGGSLLRHVCRSTRSNDRTSMRAMALRLVSLARSGGGSGPHETDRDPRARAPFCSRVEAVGDRKHSLPQWSSRPPSIRGSDPSDVVASVAYGQYGDPRMLRAQKTRYHARVWCHQAGVHYTRSVGP